MKYKATDMSKCSLKYLYDQTNKKLSFKQFCEVNNLKQELCKYRFVGYLHATSQFTKVLPDGERNILDGLYYIEDGEKRKSTYDKCRCICQQRNRTNHYQVFQGPIGNCITLGTNCARRFHRQHSLLRRKIVKHLKNAIKILGKDKLCEILDTNNLTYEHFYNYDTFMCYIKKLRDKNLMCWRCIKFVNPDDPCYICKLYEKRHDKSSVCYTSHPTMFCSSNCEDKYLQSI